MTTLKNPNLPQSKVRLAAISAAAGECRQKLNEYGIKTFNIDPAQKLAFALDTHADLRLLQFRNIIFVNKNEHLFFDELTKYYYVEEIGTELKNGYPRDVNLNAAVVGKYIICNPATISSRALKEAENQGLEIIAVKQGYSKCSTAVLNEKAIITDDESIFKAASKKIDDVTLISKGSIELNGFNYGFIGGCCGKTDKNTIAFSGEIESHASHNLIIDALARNSIDAIELKKGKLVDIGGIIPLLEENG